MAKRQPSESQRGMLVQANPLPSASTVVMERHALNAPSK